MSELNHQPCPFSSCGSSDAFGWNTETHVGYCFSCGGKYPSKGMKLFDWAKETYPLANNYSEPADAVDNRKKKEDTPTVGITGEYQAYRGITAKTMEFYGVKTYKNEKGEYDRHVYVYPNGGSKTRVFPKTFFAKDFGSDTLFGMNLFPAGSTSSITITEGELDAMSAYQMQGSKYPVVSIPGATPSPKLLKNCKDWLSTFDKIYLSMDTDNKSEDFCIALLNLFPGKVFRVPHDKFKDANEFLQAKCVKEFINAWWASKPYTPSNIFQGSEDFLSLYSETVDSPFIPTNIPDLDELILGLMQGQFTVIKAPTGIGKSEFMRYLEYNFIKNYPDVKFATWHLEETKRRSLLGVVSYHLSDNVTRKDLIEDKNADEKVRGAIREIGDKSGYMQFHLKDGGSPDELVEQIRVLSQVYGIQYVFFEPIQDTVVTGDDSSKESILADLAVKLSNLAPDLNVGIVTIAHTNEAGDPKYCKMIAQRAAVVIDLERDLTSDNLVEKNTTKIWVRKNRPVGPLGFGGEMIFDNESFTLKPKGGGW